MTLHRGPSRANETDSSPGEELRAFLMDPNFVVDDDTLVVLERFRVVD